MTINNALVRYSIYTNIRFGWAVVAENDEMLVDTRTLVLPRVPHMPPWGVALPSPPVPHPGPSDPGENHPALTADEDGDL